MFIFQREDLQVTLAAPYQLSPKPETVELGFGKYFTDHMMKIHYYKQLGGWQKPEITPFENLSIHPAAKALHYAIQVSVHLSHTPCDSVWIFQLTDLVLNLLIFPP